MKHLDSLLSRLRRLWRSDEASATPFVAVAMVMLVASVGTAIDSGRGYLVKSHLSQALDAAALAGGRVVFQATRDDDIRMFFNANFPAGYLEATITGPTIQVDENGEEVALAASAEIPTTFMRILGIETLTVSSQTVVRRSNRGMELVLVMDNTGSMSGSKINAMKAAATDLVNILFGQRETIPNFWVALVPYSATVNIGSSRTSWLVPDNPSSLYAAGGYWKGCVEARDQPYEEAEAEALPSVRKWGRFYWASNKHIQYENQDGRDYPSDNPWPSVIEVTDNNNARGPNLGCPPAITPLQPSKSVALSAIAGMGAWNRGGTMGNLGLAWGWRVLSPAWRGMWGGATPATLPMDYHTPLMDKVIVMLTDGVNEWYDYPGYAPGCDGITKCPSTNQGSGNIPHDADYTAYGRLSEGRLGTTNKSTATSRINSRMASLCTALKQTGVIIYTIVLQVNNSATQQLYEGCASKPEYYFLSPSSNDLAAIFRQIATQLSNLRLAR
ncbi:MAG: vWA domain-containing protein [Reyranellaceae bacterium]